MVSHRWVVPLERPCRKAPKRKSLKVTLLPGPEIQKSRKCTPLTPFARYSEKCHFYLGREPLPRQWHPLPGGAQNSLKFRLNFSAEKVGPQGAKGRAGETKKHTKTSKIPFWNRHPEKVPKRYGNGDPPDLKKYVFVQEGLRFSLSARTP